MNLRRDDCPLCRSTMVRRSCRKGVVDWLLSKVMIYPYRCRLCMYRFHKIEPPHVLVGSPPARARWLVR